MTVYDHNNALDCLRAWKRAQGQTAGLEWLRAHFAAVHGGTHDISWFSRVLSGRIRMTPARSEQFAAVMGLDADATRYLVLLAERDRPDASPLTEAELTQVIAGLRRKHSATALHKSQYRFFREWVHPAVLALARCRGFRWEPDWVARRLFGRVTPEEARNSLRLLADLDLLRLAPDGSVTARVNLNDSLQAPPDSRVELVDFYSQCLDLQREALAMDERQRHFSSLTLAVSPTTRAVIRKRLDAFLFELDALCEADDTECDQVAFVQVALVPFSTVD